jgi:beta-1,4-mannosyltransferase
MYEQFTSRFAYAHFAVTDAMRKHLIEKYKLRNVTTLRDLPPPRYQPLNQEAQDLFLATLPETKAVDRKTTKIIVTSTSFTQDENLTLLLWVLRRCYYTENIPRILLLITGRGPQQPMYSHLISSSILAGTDPDAKCTAKMLWLEPQDYPRLLASADLGVSLHTSSSGLDFPMKVIDLFGSGTPVCAIRFDAYHPFAFNSNKTE